MNNYFSIINSHLLESVAKQIREEIATVNNYVSTIVNPAIISAFGQVPTPDSEYFILIHDCSIQAGQVYSSYIEIENKRVKTLDDAVILGYYMED